MSNKIYFTNLVSLNKSERFDNTTHRKSLKTLTNFKNHAVSYINKKSYYFINQVDDKDDRNSISGSQSKKRISYNFTKNQRSNK